MGQEKTEQQEAFSQLTPEQQEALLQQNLYTEGLGRKRIFLGTGADITENLFGYMGDLATFAPDPGQAARYRDLRGPDVEEEARLAAFVEDAAGEATARTQQQVRELPSKVDPTKSAALIQGLSGLEDRAQGARMKAATIAGKERAESKKLRAAEKSEIEDERAEKRLGRRLAKLNLFGGLFASGFKAAAALKPKTYERKLEDKARRQDVRSERLAERQVAEQQKSGELYQKAEEHEGGRSERLASRAEEKGRKGIELGKKSEAFDVKATGTKESLAALRAAEEEKQRKRLALSAQYGFGRDLSAMTGGYGLPAAPESPTFSTPTVLKYGG